ncbi:MAG: Crp/Fnr family transcriptional regulator [Thermodesulfovibrionales bacterium]
MNNLWDNIFRFTKKKNDEIDNILLNIPIFQDLNNNELKTIKRNLHQREYKKNEVIFNQTDIGLGMYIIVKGNVDIVCEPERHVLAELHEGDFFGELSLLDESPRSATAISKVPTELLCFFKPDLLDLIERNPRLGGKILFKLAWTIGERLKRMNEQIKELGVCKKTNE